VSAIAVERVSKHWATADGQVRAVDGISFAVDAGTLKRLLGLPAAASRRRCG
jgi:ABC-type Na+ transport system ATPase subunit NatA